MGHPVGHFEGVAETTRVFDPSTGGNEAFTALDDGLPATPVVIVSPMGSREMINGKRYSISFGGTIEIGDSCVATDVTARQVPHIAPDSAPAS